MKRGYVRIYTHLIHQAHAGNQAMLAIRFIYMVERPGGRNLQRHLSGRPVPINPIPPVGGRGGVHDWARHGRPALQVKAEELLKDANVINVQIAHHFPAPPLSICRLFPSSSVRSECGVFPNPKIDNWIPNI